MKCRTSALASAGHRVPGKMRSCLELALQLGLARSSSRFGTSQFLEMVHVNDRAALSAGLRHSAETDGAFAAEFRVVFPDSSIRWLRTQGRMEFEDGQPRRLNGASIDITAAHEMVMRLEKAMRAKSEFLANMSHEIRSPMNGLLSTVELLLDLGVSDAQKEHVDTIRTCGETLLRIVNDILDISKVEAGKLVVESIPFRLEGLRNETLTLVARSAEARGLELRRELEPGLPGTLTGDSQHLRQVLLNLLSNAVKFTGQGSVTSRGVGAAPARVPAREDSRRPNKIFT